MQTLFERASQLSHKEKHALREFLEAERRIESEPIISAPVKSDGVIFDLSAGMTWMSDDFNDELPDNFWWGEE